MTATTSPTPLLDLAAKFRRLYAELAENQFFADALRLSQDTGTWSGELHMGFNAWFTTLAGHCQNQLAPAFHRVAESLERRAADTQAALARFAAGIAVPPPAPPARLNYHLPHVPGFGNIGGGTNPQMNPERVKLLARKLAGTADHGFGGPGGFTRRLEEALTPPPAPPGLAPGTPPPVNPLPPDAADATGYPHAYRHITQALRDAAADLTRRADAMAELAEPLPTATVDGGLFSKIKDLAARAAEEVGEAAAVAADAAASEAP
ncbi:MAG: hypothetical protein ACRDY7_04985, partial [Acidimicrobiia bacterium]